MKKRFFAIRTLVITIILVIGIKGAFAYQERFLNTPTEPESQEQMIFVIKPGESGKTVSENLKEKGLISKTWPFYWYLKRESLGNDIKSGGFTLSPTMTPIEMVEVITSTAGQIVFTIPEGWTAQKIDDALVEWKLIQAAEFTQCVKTCNVSNYNFLASASSVEGYLFPDTFFINPASFSVENFIHRLLDNFETKVLTAENETAIEKSDRTLEEIITMASIIEREALWDEDRPIISGILWKRLDNDWALEADATLIYVTGNPNITAQDLNLDSPYNTRKHKGLPPTAISNPGLASIRAALNSSASDYWFYLTDLETGKAHYATTNDEHNQNRKKWL